MGCTIPPFYSQAKFGFSCYGIYVGRSPPTAVTVTFSETIKGTISTSDTHKATVTFSE